MAGDLRSKVYADIFETRRGRKMNNERFVELVEGLLSEKGVSHNKLASLVVRDKRSKAKINKIKVEKAEKGEIFEERDNYDFISASTVRNYKNGILPEDLSHELFVSLALLDYEKKENHKKLSDMVDSPVIVKQNDLTEEERKKRADYVNNLMKAILGHELYARSLHDNMLILVCRGVLTLGDALDEAERYIKYLAKESKLDDNTFEKYARKDGGTLMLNIAVRSINDVSEIDCMVETYREYFHTSNLARQERIKMIYYRRNRFPYVESEYHEMLEFKHAVAVFAPAYANTYRNLGYGDNDNKEETKNNKNTEKRKSNSAKYLGRRKNVSRKWLLGLLVRLRFSRDEINEALKIAHEPVLDDSNLECLEMYLKDSDKYPLGSTGWYYEQEEKTNNDFIKRFAGFNNLNIKEKLILAIYLSSVDWAAEWTVNFPAPVSLVLESLLQDERVLKEEKKDAELLDESNQTVEELLRNIVSKVENKVSSEDCKNLVRKIHNKIEIIMKNHLLVSTDGRDSIYEAFCRETKEYYDFSNKNIYDRLAQNNIYKESVQGMRFSAALIYTILTGRYLPEGGELLGALDDVRVKFVNEVKSYVGDKKEENEILINIFGNNVAKYLTTFLDNRDLYFEKEGVSTENVAENVKVVNAGVYYIDEAVTEQNIFTRQNSSEGFANMLVLIEKMKNSEE